MICLNAPAIVWCDEPGCGASQPAKLVLRGDGTFGAVPQSTVWQLLVAPNGTLLARCPEHLPHTEQPAPRRKRVK